MNSLFALSYGLRGFGMVKMFCLLVLLLCVLSVSLKRWPLRHCCASSHPLPFGSSGFSLLRRRV